MNYYDPWKERTLQLKLAREQIARDAQIQQEGHPLVVCLAGVLFVALYILYMWLEAN